MGGGRYGDDSDLPRVALRWVSRSKSRRASSGSDHLESVYRRAAKQLMTLDRLSYGKTPLQHGSIPPLAKLYDRPDPTVAGSFAEGLARGLGVFRLLLLQDGAYDIRLSGFGGSIWKFTRLGGN